MIVEFDVILERCVGGCEEFIDQHVALRRDGESIRCARRTARHIARIPRLRVGFAIGGPGQHERVTRAIRRAGPGRLAVVGNFEDDAVGVVPQPDGAGAFEGVGEWSHYIGQGVNGLNEARVPGNDRVGACGNERVRRKGVVDVAGEAVVADFLREGIGVVDLDELNRIAVRPGQGIVHDFRDHEWRAPAGGTGRFARQNDRADGAAADVLIIAELRRGCDAIGPAAHRHADGDVGGHRDGDEAERKPVLAVKAREAGEEIVRALETQPGVGIIRGEKSSGRGRRRDRGARGEERACRTRRGEGAGKGGTHIQRVTRHEARLRPRIHQAQAGHAHLHVEIARDHLVVEGELIARSTDVISTRRDVEAA